MMATPEFPRPFQFDLPLFRNQCGPASPWNQAILACKSAEICERQSRATFDIFKKYSETRLAAQREDLQTMSDNGEEGTPDYLELKDKITKHEKKFENGGGGNAQFPFVNHDDFSFPIFRVKRDAVGNVITGEVNLQPYNIESFPSAWFPRTGNKQSGFKALDVPQPDGSFRPSGPQGKDSDGAMILYDVQAKIEYDFWQVTTLLDANGLSAGGGTVGDKILATGSVSRFDAAGVGARHPEIDPNGSSRATGLPYLGGLLLPEDLADGIESKIQHALIFAMPRLRYFPEPLPAHPPNWVYPATHTEFSNGIADPDALAAGQRIGLRDELYDRDGTTHSTTDLIKDENLPPIVRIFLDALYNYGAFLVDGAGGFAFAAEDIHTANLTAAQAKDLTDPAVDLEDNVTPWQHVMEFLNDYLYQKLLNESGLAFAYLDDTNGFRPNFFIAEDLESFYREQI
ncbi:hypothetical protein [uncultured Gimesia sp.]|jgi:hypothetical protein|uniref:hypothetical protein n=1 Tax=uncultured Gimesia sp. TaxID=1678688 RepID=UPI0026045176|nr:hypothetical protein [uncultured Gimesia sp.]